ncbi:hypothetical protein EIP91_004858 [Steccherinum ochraceum]|uniref:DRBM domain-containing protein n=1 Tax=Steccherinum ochraceum TaxID=92696 RepID=A0A4R0RWA0_9APHY|nr:hypothetical protein EIP91_004858 [Steccherinum ochraceum]
MTLLPLTILYNVTLSEVGDADRRVAFLQVGPQTYACDGAPAAEHTHEMCRAEDPLSSLKLLADKDMAAANIDPVVALNNYLQETRQESLLSTTDSHVGKSHAPEWTVIYKFDGEVIGTGTGPSKTAAKETAAHEALVKLITRAAAAAETTTIIPAAQ